MLSNYISSEIGRYVTGAGIGIMNMDPATHQDLRFVSLIISIFVQVMLSMGSRNRYEGCFG